MNVLKSAFKALTPEQQAIFTGKRVEGQRSPDEWLELLTPVAELDEQCDALRVSKAGFFVRRFARKHDVPNGLRLFTLPLLPILREDHDPAVPLELRIDLTGPQQKSSRPAPVSRTSAAAITRSSTPSTTTSGWRVTLASSTAPTSALRRSIMSARR